MDISQISAGARSILSITPESALEKGAFCLGLNTSIPTLDLDQAYAVELYEADDMVLDIVEGTAVATNATLLKGGDGEDTDNVDISLTQLGFIHIRNVGVNAVKVSLDYNGATDVVAEFPLLSTGEIFLASQNIVNAGILTLEPLVAGEKITAHVVVAGKI